MNHLSLAFFSSASILLFLAIVTVCLRLYVRIYMVKAVGIDDYIMTIALLFNIVAEAFVFNALSITQGKSLLQLIAVVSPAYKSIYLGEIFYVITVCLVKWSIGTFLLRLVKDKRQIFVVYATLGVVTFVSIAYWFMVVFQCTPISHFWHPFDGKGKCLSGKLNTHSSWAHASVIGTSDFVFASIPIFMVWNLQMNKAMKLSIAGLLGLFAIGGITSFMRMPYIKVLEEGSSLDFFDAVNRLAIWTCIEPAVGIIAGSIATLRPLFTKFLGGTKIFPSKNTRSRYWPSSKSSNLRSGQDEHQMDSFARSNRKMGLSSHTQTVIEGDTTNSGQKRGRATSESEVALNTKDSRDFIHKTVEFEAVTSSNQDFPSPTSENHFPGRRTGKDGFY